MQITNRATAVWCACLTSALRTGLACAIVACLTEYAPPSYQTLAPFAAFSYVTVALIVLDATLGDTLHACWLALYATVQSMGPAILIMWLIEPARLTKSVTALAVAFGGLIVLLPDWNHVVAKRIALGQILVVYINVYASGGGDQSAAVMDPLHMAASTAVGVLACVLAMLLPYPRLACYEVKNSSEHYAENASERLKLFVNALFAQDKTSTFAFVSQTKSLKLAASRIQQTINRYQGSMKWERVPFLSSNYINPKEKLQDIEIALRGMELALENSPKFPPKIISDGNLNLDGELLGLEKLISLTVKQTSNSSTVFGSECSTEKINNSLTVLNFRSNAETTENFLHKFDKIPQSHQDLPSFFFLFSLKLLHTKLSSKKVKVEGPKCHFLHKIGFFSFKSMTLSLKSPKLLSALNRSIALGLAVYMGLIYDKHNAFWSGLVVSTTLPIAQEATFRLANVRGQGNALGAVYGVLISFLFQRSATMRFLFLLPWFVFTSTIRDSRMYGRASEAAAVLAASLILGRKHFIPQSPSGFAIQRITEVFIGLACSLLLDLIFQPTRASTKAQAQLSKTLGTLHDCIGLLSLGKAQSLLEKQKELKMEINELEKLIGIANVEPSFWFLPFPSSCYQNLLTSLSKMSVLLYFGAQALLELESETLEPCGKDVIFTKLAEDIRVFREFSGSLTKCLEEISAVESLTALENEVKKSKVCDQDLERGKFSNSSLFRGCGDEEEMGRMLSLFLEHSREIVDGIEMKSEVVLSLSALGFCMESCMREIREIEGGIRELVQRGNPSSYVDLYKISCKIRSLYN